jgi:hypothetical protein
MKEAASGHFSPTDIILIEGCSRCGNSCEKEIPQQDGATIPATEYWG